MLLVQHENSGRTLAALEFVREGGLSEMELPVDSLSFLLRLRDAKVSVTSNNMGM
jgi:hypothetical protein